MLKEVIETIGSKFKIDNITENKASQFFITAEKSELMSLLTYLKDIEGFKHLILLSAVDYIENEIFQLTYLLNCPAKKIDLCIRVKIDRNKPVMESAHHLWETTATYQRELKEMFGIDFPGSPGVDESFLLEDWDDIPPYRRDFDTKKYAEETYFPRPGRETHNPSDYMREKLYPGE